MSGSVELQPSDVVIRAFGHDWDEPTYAWSADNGSVVATRVCKHDANHAETEAVRTTAKTTKETSCAKPGEVVYTATFANEAFKTQTKEVEVAPLAHTPGDAVLENEVAPTCEKDGSRDVVSYCTVCHKELTRVHEVIPATGHSWSAWTVTTPATCEGRGVETRACQNDSSHMETRQIEALGHDWDEGTLTVAPTCSAEGTRVYTCRHDASHTRTETVEKLRHQTAHRTEKISAATCTQGERSWDVTYCTVCGEVIERQLMEGEPLGHDWDAPTYTWSEDNGLVTAKRVCAHDESHVELETVETTNRVIAAATCTKAGEVVYEATFENDAFASQSKTTELPALGHEWGEASYAWAEDNAFVVATRSCMHDESHVEAEIASCTAEVTKQPTCTEAGETAYTATFQNLAFAPQSKVVEDLEPLGHEAGPAVREQVVAATCEEAGSYELVTNCARCGEELSREEVTVPALGHDWGVWKTTTEATCVSAGIQTRTCKNDASHVETREVAVLGHDWGEWSVTERATCTKAGLETRVCRNDDAHVETREVAALGHDWGDWYVAKAPTCTERGIEKRTCKNDSDHGEAHFIDALGHDWVEPTYVWAEDDASVTATRACSRDETHVEAETVAVTSTVTKPATCTEDGETTLVARFENDSFKEQSKTIVLPATGHEPATPVRENLIEATCTEAGSFESVTYCKLCGEGLLRTQEYLSPLGHSWDEGVVTLAPTCEDEGVRTYTCRNDASHTRTEALPALGHDWSPWEVTVPSSEDSEGEESRVCRHDSSHVQTRVIPALGHEHQLVKVEAIQPTCIEDGNVEYWVCDKGEHPCGRFFLDQDAQQEVSYEDVVILALGHTWDEGVVTVEPSCTVDGVRVHTCGICGATKEEPEEKTLHENEWVDETIIEPTCMARGYHWHVLRCVKCGEAMTRLLREDAPLGHDWGEPTYTWSEDDSSVTATRVCARDASHVESETVAVTTTVTREATKTEDGEKVLTATFANPVFSPQEKVVAIPATGEPDDPTPEDFSYAIVEGANSTWTRGSGEPVVMVVKRSLADETCFAHFSGVRIDGVALDDGDFEARSGSTVITFRPGYLQTLATGGHEVDILFDDGSVSTTLTVLEASSGPVDPTPEPDAEQPVTPDGGSNRSSGGSATPASSLRAVIPQTGDVMGLRHALLALASCGMLALYVG
ncbi:MAG: hypothetical protein IJ092_04170, partial [Atopobiaceae bacterium]|nr:hypothetical protein [Atopobiaceae bacterium]